MRFPMTHHEPNQDKPTGNDSFTDADWSNVHSDLRDEKAFVDAVEAALRDEYAELADL